MANPYVLTQGDSLTRIRVKCTHAQSSLPVDLNGATLKFRCKVDNRTVAEWALTPVVPMTDGIAEYQLADLGADLPYAGTMRAQVEITSNGRIIASTEDIIVTVKKRIA